MRQFLPHPWPWGRHQGRPQRGHSLTLPTRATAQMTPSLLSHGFSSSKSLAPPPRPANPSLKPPAETLDLSTRQPLGPTLHSLASLCLPQSQASQQLHCPPQTQGESPASTTRPAKSHCPNSPTSPVSPPLPGTPSPATQLLPSKVDLSPSLHPPVKSTHFSRSSPLHLRPTDAFGE